MPISTSKVAKSAVLRSSVVEDRRALLQRILWSRPIEKSVRIRELLSYVCERSFSDPSAEIPEQEIGHGVFGRPAGYDTNQDNIVRVTASQARRKLEQYFAADGASEPVILEIPKGQYAPLFRERGALPLGIPEALPDAVVPGQKFRRRAAVVAAWSAPFLAIAVIGLAMQLQQQRRASASVLEVNPNLNALWSQLLAPGSRTEIVVSDSSLSLFQELLDHQLSLSEYLKPDVWTSAASLASNPQLQLFAQRAAQRRFTSLANVTFAYRAARLTGRDPSRISMFSARDFNMRQMQFDNVILLGSSRANPWVELIADRLNFRFAFDQKLRYSYFENREPRPGEPTLFRSNSGVSFCHIAFVPNLGRTGAILQIAGTEVEGTEGGGEFLTDERSMAQLRGVVPLDREGRFPYFEILLKSTRVGGVAPRFSVVGSRLLHL